MYASKELGYVALNCPVSGEWLHLNEADYFAETDADGEILITDFNNRLMPMLRYRTGDIGEIKETSCACGASGKSLKIYGRKGKFIENDSGGRLYETSLINFSFSARLPFFQAAGGQGGSPVEITLLKKDAGLEAELSGAAQRRLGIAGRRLKFRFADNFKIPPSGKFCFLP
jgi:hypothetical protein